MKTRLTKTGQPVMGTTIELHLDDDTWEPVKVVGKGFGVDGTSLVMVIVEYAEGDREFLQPFADVDWRSA